MKLGPYELGKRIGRGGMAEVLRAKAPDGTDVVVKRMLPHLTGDATYEKMFLREARVAAQLDHPNVTRLLDVGRDGEDLYLVFDLVDGVTLYELARRAWQAERAIPVELCLRAVADAAIGLHHAHELKDESGALAGLVHRDVSPDNLMADTHGVTRVLDFGIAKLDDTAGRFSKTGELRGKLAFMSPEQAQGHKVDRRSDLFSLGTTLFWLLTAQRPFSGRTDILTLRALLEQPAPLVSSVNPRVPRGVSSIVKRLLEKDPAKRYATAREVHDAIVKLLPPGDDIRRVAGAFVAEISALRTERVEGTEIVMMPATVPSACVMLVDLDGTTDNSKLPRAKRWPLVAAGAGALAVVVAGLAVVLGGHNDVVVVDAGVVSAHVDAGVVASARVDAGEEEPVVDEDEGVELAPLDPAHPRATRRVTVLFPAGTQLRHGGRALKPGPLEVAASARSVSVVDASGGVHDVPIKDGKADYASLGRGTVRVWLPPAGGEVFLGGKSLGMAPIKPLDLVVGKYKLKARSGDKVEEQKLVVTAGQNPPVRFFAK